LSFFLSGFHESDTYCISANCDANQDKSTILGQLEPHCLELLGKLISLVHKNIKYIGKDQYTTTDLNYESSETSNQSKHVGDDGNAPDSINDSLAQIFLSLEPLALQNILLALVVRLCTLYFQLIFFILELLILYEVRFNPFYKFTLCFPLKFSFTNGKVTTS
jgi:hypothetical protein